MIKTIPELVRELHQARLERARAVAARYDEELGATRHEVRPESLPSPWLYTIFVDDPGAFISHAASRAVVAAQPHRRNDAYPFARAVQCPLPHTDDLLRRGVRVFRAVIENPVARVDEFPVPT